MTPADRVHVAVAILQRNDGSVLWCQRPDGKPYAGYWEFPGGKLEAGETPWQALVREIREELGIEALAGGPWMVIDHDYPHAKVRLHLYRVWDFAGDPQSREGQAFCWDALLPQDRVTVQPILPATEPILPRLAMPACVVLSDVQSMGLDAFVQRLSEFSRDHGAFLLQFREFELAFDQQLSVFEQLSRVQSDLSMTLQVHAGCDALLKHLLDLNLSQQTGLHLPQRLLDSTEPHLDRSRWAFQTAAVHDANALAQAFSRGVDAAILGTVLPTPTHPGEWPCLGWAGFEAIAVQSPMPVYAIGGMTPSDLMQARLHGAHGVAFRRALGVATSAVAAAGA